MASKRRLKSTGPVPGPQTDTLRQAQLGDWFWDIRTDRMHWSDEMHRIHGTDPATFGATLEAVARFIHPDDLPRQEQAIRGLLEGTPFLPFEYRVCRPDGTLRVVRIEGVEVSRDASGQPVRIFGTAIDVTEVRRATDALHRIEEALREAQRLSKSGNWRFAVGTARLTWSDQMFDLFDRDPALGEPGWPEQQASIHPDDRARLDSAVEAALHRGIGYSREFRVVRKDGSITWARSIGRPELAPDGAVTEIHGTVQDITEQKAAEQALLALDARYRELFQRMNDGIAIGRAVSDGDDFVITDINPAGERISGVRRGEVIARTVRNVFSGALPSGILEAYRRVWRTGRPEEVPAVVHEGGRIRTWVQNSIFRMSSGEIAIVYRDITETRRAEEEIRQFSRRLLAVREDERKSVATTLHHRTGSLVVGVMARLQAAEVDLRAGRLETGLAFLEEGRRLFQESVAMLKDFAVGLRPPDLDLLGLTAALRQHFATVTRGTPLRVGFIDNGRGVTLDHDTATVLFRIAQEALNNAVLHGHAKAVRVRLDALKTEIRMTIRDDGTGFDTEAVARLRPGTIGLISMREMSMALGGRVKVESAPGQGTLVTVWLPYLGGGERP